MTSEIPVVSVEITGNPAHLGANGITSRRATAAAARDPLLADLREGIGRYHLWFNLGWNDIRSRYRRTVLGPFWTVLSTATFVGALGLVNAILWKVTVSTYLPFFCAGYISWLLFITIVNEGGSSIIAAEGTIKTIRVPYTVFIFRVLTRNLVVFAHNLVVFALIGVVFWLKLSPNMLLLPVGLGLAVLNYAWISLLLAVVCVRFRDVIQLVANVSPILFFVTPIFWPPSLLDTAPAARIILVDANFAYHLIEVIRAPLLGQAPGALSFFYLGCAAVVGWGLTWLFLRPCYNRIAYWL